ncbi:MAG: ribosomal-processing cysteine protease Prp [Sporomusaceae bacterium]|nr:ribosomal-processing cysteine protease Prp [Sporomusaceae bacterium]
MISIEIFYLAGQIKRFSVAGHANVATRGKDIVCAGVSALTQSAVLGLMNHLERELDLQVAEGQLDCTLREVPDDLTEAVCQTMLLGLKEIAKISPKSVRIIEHRR